MLLTLNNYKNQTKQVCRSNKGETMLDEKSKKNKATEIRIRLLEMINHAGTGHTGGALSSVEILVSLFYHTMKHDASNPEWSERDRFLLSKGHSVEGYLCILADLGYFADDELKTFSAYQSRLIGHPSRKVPGIEMNTGALGHALSVSTGLAIAAKKLKQKHRVFTLMGDGEQAEGSIWEAAMAASHYKLGNLVGIIDRNYLQISGNTEKVMALDHLNEKWSSFGWKTLSINGNNITELCDTFDNIDYSGEQPTLIIARTTKGKGVSFMEDVAKWHHGVPKGEDFEKALSELRSQLIK